MYIFIKIYCSKRTRCMGDPATYSKYGIKQKKFKKVIINIYKHLILN